MRNDFAVDRDLNIAYAGKGLKCMNYLLPDLIPDTLGWIAQFNIDTRVIAIDMYRAYRLHADIVFSRGGINGLFQDGLNRLFRYGHYLLLFGCQVTVNNFYGRMVTNIGNLYTVCYN